MTIKICFLFQRKHAFNGLVYSDKVNRLYSIGEYKNNNGDLKANGFYVIFVVISLY